MMVLCPLEERVKEDWTWRATNGANEGANEWTDEWANEWANERRQ
jgi:hypothetical protein